jgi:hypothetical protein
MPTAPRVGEEGEATDGVLLGFALFGRIGREEGGENLESWRLGTKKVRLWLLWERRYRRVTKYKYFEGERNSRKDNRQGRTQLDILLSIRRAVQSLQFTSDFPHIHFPNPKMWKVSLKRGVVGLLAITSALVIKRQVEETLWESEDGNTVVGIADGGMESSKLPLYDSGLIQTLQVSTGAAHRPTMLSTA